MAQHTPMIQHYLKVKEQYPSGLLFYRLGDFYELFFEDAEKASQLLNLTLTKRGEKNGNPIPMAGIPHHSADNYLSRLVKMDQTIVICDQVTAAAPGQPPERKVTRVITPGTLTDDVLLPSEGQSILCAIHFESKGKQVTYGISYIELSSGRFCVTFCATEDQVLDECARIKPSELIIHEELPSIIMQRLKEQYKQVSKRPPWDFSAQSGYRLLIQQFKSSDLHAFSLENKPLLQGTAGAILNYLKITQQNNMDHIQTIRTETIEDAIHIDKQSRQHLDLTPDEAQNQSHTLLNIFPKSATPMGKRLLARWLGRPLRNQQEIMQRLDAIEQLQTSQTVIFDLLREVGDLERVCARIGTMNPKPRDLIQLKNALAAVDPIKHQLPPTTKLLQNLHQHINPLPDLHALLTKAIVDEPPAHTRDGGFIKEGFDSELDTYRKLLHDHETILSEIEKREAQQYSFSTLKVRYNKVHGFYIELSKAQAVNAPDHYIRRQTLKNVERFTIPELKSYEDKVLGAQSKSLAREKQLYMDICQRLLDEIKPLTALSWSCAVLDTLIMCSGYSIANNVTRPTFSSKPEVTIKSGRHPIIEHHVEHFQSNDSKLSASESLMLLTGPNMGGKSTYMRQVALLTIMAHIGCPIPAESAIFGPIDRIFTRIGSGDDLAGGRSTFMVEMSETAHILHHATPYSLVLLDEIGRGTSTYDGLALAYATAKYLLEKNKSMVMFATHYFELTTMIEQYTTANNYHVVVDEHQDKLIFQHRVASGALDRSYGIHVARLAGIPEEVVIAAKAYQHHLAKTNNVACDEKDDHVVLEELSELDPDTMNPRDALTALYRLKALLAESTAL